MYKIVNRKKLYATMAADLVGSALYAPRRLLRRPAALDRESVKKILLIRTAYAGDVVMTLPLMKPLRQGFPQARISFLTSQDGAELVRGNPLVDEIFTYTPFWFYPGQTFQEYRRFIRSLKARSFDLVIEARGDLRDLFMLVRPLRARHKVSYAVGGGRYLLTHVVPYAGLTHKVDYHLNIARFLGCEVTGIEWGIALSREEEDQAASMLVRAGVEGPFLAGHPGSRVPLKQWLPARYAELFDRLMKATGLPLVLLGNERESPQVAQISSLMQHRPISLAGRTSLRDLAGVLKRATVFVCNDSAPMHIAASMGTRTVAIFGPSKSVETGPYGERCASVERPMPCRKDCDEGSCRNDRFHACMRDLSVDEVVQAFQRVYSSYGPASRPPG